MTTVSDGDARVALERLLGIAGSALEERAQLRHALESRIVIEQAKGMLAERLRLSLDDAFAVLRRAARSNGTKLHGVAQRVVEEPETPAEVLAALAAHLGRARR